MLLKEMSEFHKTAVFNEDNQGSVLLVNNMQVGRRPKNIDIRHHFMEDIVEYKDMDINYVRS